MRQTNEQVTFIQCCFNTGPAALKRPFQTNSHDNAFPVCTFKQLGQKAVFAHFTGEQILPLQADNVLQPVVWGG